MTTSDFLWNIARRSLNGLPAPLAGSLRAAKRSVLNLRSRKAVFSDIACHNSWDGTESISGPGSTMAATAFLRAALPTLLEKYRIASILDIPCGDAYWISKTIPNEVSYIGADIVAEIVERNCSGKSGFGHFQTLDLVSGDLPRVDLVFVRDCFIHLPNRMVLEALKNVNRSGAQLLMTTTYPGQANNKDIEIGGFRPVDLQAAPFCLPEPLEIILENEGKSSGKSMALWRTNELR